MSVLKKRLNKAFFIMAMALASQSSATTVSYILDQSNALPDGVDYVSVMMSDDISGQLDFWVETQSSLSDIAGTNFGIQSFAFDISDGSAAQPATDDFMLPERWRMKTGKRMGEAGRFDFRVSGRGNSRQDPLHFSVLGVGLEDIDSYFAVRVAGFNYSDSISSAYFYGGTLSQVPVPAAVWLFGSGLFGLIGVPYFRQLTAVNHVLNKVTFKQV